MATRFAKKQNAWVEHIKLKAKEMGISYSVAMLDPKVKESYKKLVGRLEPPTREAIKEPQPVIAKGDSGKAHQEVEPVKEPEPVIAKGDSGKAHQEPEPVKGKSTDLHKPKARKPRVVKE